MNPVFSGVVWLCATAIAVVIAWEAASFVDAQIISPASATATQCSGCTDDSASASAILTLVEPLEEDDQPAVTADAANEVPTVSVGETPAAEAVAADGDDTSATSSTSSDRTPTTASSPTSQSTANTGDATSADSAATTPTTAAGGNTATATTAATSATSTTETGSSTTSSTAPIADQPSTTATTQATTTKPVPTTEPVPETGPLTSVAPGGSSTSTQATTTTAARSTTSATSTTEPTTTTAPTTTSSPSTSSSSSTTQPPVVAEVRTFRMIGGTTAVAFSPDEVEVLWATPNEGFSVDVDRERVEFESDDHRSRIDLWWNDGPRWDIDERSSDGSHDNLGPESTSTTVDPDD